MPIPQCPVRLEIYHNVPETVRSLPLLDSCYSFCPGAMASLKSSGGPLTSVLCGPSSAHSEDAHEHCKCSSRTTLCPQRGLREAGSDPSRGEHSVPMSEASSLTYCTPLAASLLFPDSGSFPAPPWLLRSLMPLCQPPKCSSVVRLWPTSTAVCIFFSLSCALSVCMRF